ECDALSRTFALTPVASEGGAIGAALAELLQRSGLEGSGVLRGIDGRLADRARSNCLGYSFRHRQKLPSNEGLLMARMTPFSCSSASANGAVSTCSRPEAQTRM